MPCTCLYAGASIGAGPLTLLVLHDKHFTMLAHACKHAGAGIGAGPLIFPRPGQPTPRPGVLELASDQAPGPGDQLL